MPDDATLMPTAPPTPVQDCPLDLDKAKQVILEMAQEILKRIESEHLEKGSLHSVDYALKDFPEVPLMRFVIVFGATAVDLYNRCMVSALAGLDERLAAAESREAVQNKLAEKKLVVN